MNPTPYESLIDTMQLVRDGVLDAHPDFLSTPIEELLEICNGCGAAGAKIDLVPDTMWFMSVKPVCHLHDFGFKKGKTIEDKEMEDRRMMNNYVRLIDQNSNWLMRRLRYRRAKKYYKVVHYFGGPAFWKGKNKPQNG